MNLKYSFPLFLLIFNFTVYSQTVEPSASVDKNILQIELESLYSIQKEGSEEMKSWSIPSALLRYGLTNTIELQFNAPLIKENLYEDDHLVHSLHKFDDIQVGFAVNLWEQQKMFPEASLMIRAIVPIENGIKLNEIGKVVSLNLSNKLTNKLTFNYNIGFVEEFKNSTTGFFVTNFCFAYSSKIRIFIENFGDFSKHYKASHNLNFGGDYSLTENLCVGFSIANGLNHNLFYAGGILSWAINTKKN